jgi:radical SAM superfamily enzyme YgiQ (UPF0313 family)
MADKIDLSHKKLIEKLIDKKGRRKYFRELNPTLLDTPFEINTQLLKKKCKILFIMPNFNWIDEDVNALWDLLPWNLCLLASMIEDIASEVKIIDAYKENLSEEELTKKIINYKPDIAGITVLMDQYSKVAPMTTKIIKDISPKIITVLGGVYATTNPKNAIEDKNLDYVIIGEGEFVFRQLVGFYSGACDLPDKGICFKTNGNGKIDYRGHAPFIKNLDLLPKPAYYLIDFLGYAKQWSRKSVDQPGGYPYARIVTSRGCPEKCSFCQVPVIQGSYFRARSPDHVCDEIEWLKKKYGIKSFVFDDDNMFTNKKRAKALLSKIIERNLSMPWTSIATAVFRLDEEIINLMVESGCLYIDVAIESGTDRITRDIILKPINFDHAKKMVAYARKKGIFVAANFIVGFPTESWQEIRQTIAFAEELNVNYAKIFNAIPLRNTEMFDLARETGSLIMNRKDSESKWTVGGVIKSDDWTVNDLTILRAYEWDRINFTDPIKLKKIADRMDISIDELNNIRKKTLDNAIKSISARHLDA